MPPRTLTLHLNADQAAALAELQSSTGEPPARAILTALRAAARTRRQSAERLATVERQAEELRLVNGRLEETLAELRRVQEQVVMREKLAALGQLTAGVAHEMRNPLNFIKNFAEGCVELLDEINDELGSAEAGHLDTAQRRAVLAASADIRENLKRILLHSGRANRIVGDMLLMGRGGGKTRTTPINELVNDHVRYAYQRARAADPDCRVAIVTDYDDRVGALDVVPEDLGRVVLNLVGNACDATGERRRSGAEAGWLPAITVATRRLADTVEIRVRDNGNGIPPDVVNDVFTPFFTTKPADRGTGLGLALSMDIVRSHGGDIRIDTVVNEFTEMIVELPVDAAAHPQRDASAVGRSGRTP